jgi:hypothetical protein
MTSDVEKILAWLYRREFASGVYEFDNLLLHAAITMFRKSTQDAFAFVSRNSNSYWAKLADRLKEDRASGRSPLFEVFDYNSKRVVWPPARHSLAHPQKKLYQRLISRPAYLRAIDTLTNREYEALPCIAMKMAGGRHWHLTPPGNEWGVDFFASLVSPSVFPIFNGLRAPMRIVGQCKKYESRLTVKEVRDFSRTLEGLRNRKPELEKHVPNWFRVINGPIVPWLICHSGAQSGALSFAKDEGIIVSDSIDIAECLCFLKELRGVRLREKSIFIKTCCQAMIAPTNTRGLS